MFVLKAALFIEVSAAGHVLLQKVLGWLPPTTLEARETKGLALVTRGVLIMAHSLALVHDVLTLKVAKPVLVVGRGPVTKGLPHA